MEENKKVHEKIKTKKIQNTQREREKEKDILKERNI